MSAPPDDDHAGRAEPEANGTGRPGHNGHASVPQTGMRSQVGQAGKRAADEGQPPPPRRFRLPGGEESTAIRQLDETGPRFACWAGQGENPKEPLNAHSGKKALVNKPATWASLATAEKAAEHRGYAGSGYMLGPLHPPTVPG